MKLTYFELKDNTLISFINLAYASVSYSCGIPYLLASKDFAILVAFLVPLPQFDRVEHNVAERTAVVLPFLWIEVCHTMLGKLEKFFQIH